MPYTLETAAQAAIDAAYDRALEDAAVKLDALAHVSMVRKDHHLERHQWLNAENEDIAAKAMSAGAAAIRALSRSG
jgi:hypothetical protein